MRYFFTSLFIFATFSLQAQQLSCEVNAESAILMNADSGVILFEKKSHSPQHPASITKIATAAYALKKCGDQLDAIVVAEQDSVVAISEEKRRKNNYSDPAYWLVHGGSHIGIKKDEEMTLKDLMNGMMVASGNDAANVIAQHVSKSIPAFMKELNAYLREIGCKETVFYNPHGLHHPKHQTTAYDMAMMTKEAMKSPVFREIVSTVRCQRPKTNKQAATTLVQTNRLLKKGKHYYAKAIGVKTGYTSASGSTLVAAAKQGDRTLIAVILKCKERDDTLKDAVTLFETAFNQPKIKKVLLASGPQEFQLELAGASQPVATVLKEDLSIEYYPAEEPSVKCMLYWEALTPPVAKDQRVGELRMQAQDGKTLQKLPLFAQADVNSTWAWSLKQAFKGSGMKWLGLGMLLSLLVGLFLMLRRS